MLHALLTARIPFWRRIARAAVDALFPEVCPWCAGPLGADDDRLACRSCAPYVERIQTPFCERCGVPLDAGEPPVICGRCRANPAAFDRLRGVVVYSEKVARAIRAFKYERQIANGFALAHVLARAQAIGIHWERYDAILPVPLYPARFRHRWFNQALLLVSEMPGSERLPIRGDWLRRVRDTQPQATLTERERGENVRGAFAVRDGVPIRGRRVLLVDDVATTGSTLNECARMCKKAGAAGVDAVVVARARVS
jgi:ComF family protein